MGVFYETVPESLVKWILNQNVFWVATAPLSASGHVNVSPKGGKYFGLLDEKTFWYMDLTGSGNETLAHLHEPGNGRITVMFNAFEGAPKIVRLWGKGRAIERGGPEFSNFVNDNKVELLPGTRSIIMVDIHQVGSSCGFSVPFYEFKDFRPTLNDHFEKLDSKHQRTGKIEDSMDHYWAYKNAWSMDNLPGMVRAQSHGRKHKVAPIKKMIGPLAPTHYSYRQSVSMEFLSLIALMCFLMGFVLATYAPVWLGDKLNENPLNLKSMNATDMPVLRSFPVLWATR